jgi:hypothetical protein
MRALTRPNSLWREKARAALKLNLMSVVFEVNLFDLETSNTGVTSPISSQIGANAAMCPNIPSKRAPARS